jgi:ABC-2 type transport system permease protein
MNPATRQLLKVHRRSVSVERQGNFPPPSMLYLAGLIPMFLLFNSSGAASGILTELETGATRRVMVAPVAAADYLFGYMVSGMAMAFLQCVSMYAFAALFFEAPIVEFAAGLTMLTFATCLSTVGFGVLMASVSRSAEQLNSLGTVVILGMSAIGGSMFPRFMMPDWVKPLGLFTINGWAYDGFLDVVLGRGTLAALPESTVLCLIGIAGAALGSILLSRRLRGATGG